MKAETKATIKVMAIALAAIAGLVGIIWLLPVKVTLAVIFVMQFVILIAVGGTNLKIDNEQKKQKEQGC